MTEVQRNEILELLRNSGFINCRYRPSDGHFFLCTAGKKGNRYREFFLKENKCRIGFWGDDYEIMREWADAVIGPVFSVNGWVYGRKRNDRPEGEEAVWFNLVNSGMNVQGGTWFAQRQAVIDVAVRLYKKLNVSGIFAMDFTAENYANGLSQGAATDETTCPRFLSNASSKEQEQGSDDTTINQAASAKEEDQGTELIQPIRKESINGLGLAANMSQYWQEYYDFWDWFVQEWFNLHTKAVRSPEYDGCNYDKISSAYSDCVAELNPDELPEPYLGRPREGVDAVIINLNPGMSQGGKNTGEGGVLEMAKLFSKIDQSEGWMIRMYRATGDKGRAVSYYRFINEIEFKYKQKGEQLITKGLSSLNPDLRNSKPEVCGVKWWQGNLTGKEMWRGKERERINSEKKRIEWIRRMYKEGDWISPSRVFALELCPYHSFSFNADLKDEYLLRFINKHIIGPAITAVVENGLPFALAVGAPVKIVLDELSKRKWIVAEEIREWSYKDLKTTACMKWPQTWKKSINGFGPSERTYRLYSIRTTNGQMVRILVTWANGTFCAPKNEFNDVEADIRSYMN